MFRHRLQIVAVFLPTLIAALASNLLADALKVSPHGSLNMACDKCHIATSWTIMPEKLAFDHSETVFPLLGRHHGVSCRSCHAVLQFDKAGSTCAECHDDPHQGQFGLQCAACHSPESWENRSDMELRHSATRFPLSGVHRSVDCQSCHAEGKYVGTPTECVGCHAAAFQGAHNPNHVQANFPSDCKVCHSLETTGWTGAQFTHTQSFPLTQGHNVQDCAACHNAGYQNTPTQCISCHRSAYNGVTDPNHQALPFPEECQSCHKTTAAWTPAEFDHTLARFQLTGAHNAVDCASCHVGSVYTGTSQECFGCHESNFQEVLDPNHVNGNYDHNCTTCHNNNDWDEITFDHNISQFALTGAHQTTDCAKCHVDNKFNGIPQECFPCHQTNYEGVTEPNHVEAKLDQKCEICHTTAVWKPSTFDHQLTNYPLTGAHQTTTCASCHSSGQFKDLTTDCYTCHLADYTNSVDPSHTESKFNHDCTLCHTTTVWEPSTFNHQTTDFVLTGAHTTATCASCHSSGQFADLATECLACHRLDFEATHDPDHAEKNFDEKCQICHTTVGWQPAIIDHSQTNFPLTGAHRSASCQDCHLTGGFDGARMECQFCHMQEFDDARDPAHIESGFSRDCATCHKTTKWNDASYDHSLSRFALTGAHRAANCASCHAGGRYTGTTQDCYTCHQVAYQQASRPNHAVPQIDHNCTSCHTTNGWSPSTFSHSATNYPLTGSHKTADCAGCHIAGRFAGTSDACYTCHQGDFEQVVTPNHRQGQFLQDCTPCHSTVEWSPATMHQALSDYPLTGAHRRVDCASCHVGGVFAGTQTVCFSCHGADFEGAQDPNHREGQFNQNCASCHSTGGWSPATFDHAATDYPLTGAHQAVDCALCHQNGRFNGTPTECYPCHQADFDGVEQPNHRLGELDHDCTPCHTTEVWTPSTFDHSATDYPLTGAHKAVECSACHINNLYNNTPRECYPCHQQDFVDVQQPNHQQGQYDQNCTICHSTEAWSPATFDHADSDFPLTGAHREVACASCHENGQYNNTPTACYPCHQDDFDGANEPNHQQLQFDHNCTICHSVEAWSPAQFDHDNTDYPLTGAHRQVGCASCHANGRYDGTPTDCYTCHTADFNNVANPDHETPRFPHACLWCHTTDNWNSNYNHQQYFPISAGRHRQGQEWDLCSECHNNPNDYNVFTCIACHEHSNRGEVDRDHREVRNYRYTSEGCYDCHPQGREDVIQPIRTKLESEKNLK